MRTSQNLASAARPEPLPHGSRQEVEVAVPWPNEMFYYALAAWDGAGNR